MLQICGALNHRIYSKGPAMTKCLAALFAAALAALPAIANAAACGPSGAIVSVRNSSIGAFEYVVFKFHKPPTVPTYTVKAVSPPFTEDPSDEPISVAGSKFTEVTFQSVFWMCEIAHKFHLPKTAIKDIKRTSQFEGVVSYVIGRRAASHYISNYSFDSGAGYRSIVIKYRK
jgi:hypothetical protein